MDLLSSLTSLVGCVWACIRSSLTIGVSLSPGLGLGRTAICFDGVSGLYDDCEPFAVSALFIKPGHDALYVFKKINVIDTYV
jgi:hypothetical protein